MILSDILVENYIPYAKGVIISRAIPAIDGLKPVNRRILYSMYKMNLTKTFTKSANVVGACMLLHPHGDRPIYDALARMTTGNEALNVPYLVSKGFLGKAYSKDSEPAAPRYTEVKIAGICNEMFDGLEEDAVDFVDNYDSSTKEPTLLPVKFPSILINSSPGIAVSTSSHIPTFSLDAVCRATIGVLDESIKSTAGLCEVLEMPDFPTGGYIYRDDKELKKLMETGRGTFEVSGKVELYRDKIVIINVPPRVNIEAILNEVKELAKEGVFNEVADVRDESDITGLRGVIELKRGYDVREVYKKMMIMTRMKTSITYNTRVVMGVDGQDRCLTLGIRDVIDSWIEFRLNTLNRIYKHRLSRAVEREELLRTWEIIGDRIKEVVNFIANRSEDEAVAFLAKEFKLSRRQIDYIMNMRIRDITSNRLLDSIKSLEKIRQEIENIKQIIASRKLKQNIIIKELREIAYKYGEGRKTTIADKLVLNTTKKEAKEIPVSNTAVTVSVSRSGYVRKMSGHRDLEYMGAPEGDTVDWHITTYNLDTLLVITEAGICHKVPVQDIPSGKVWSRYRIQNHIDNDRSKVLLVIPANNYSDNINVVYGNGRCEVVSTRRFSGNRKKYINVFRDNDEKFWVTLEDQIFIITSERRAKYVDFGKVLKLAGRDRISFRGLRLQRDDSIFGIQTLSNVPDIEKIDIEKYTNEYGRKIKNDRLW